MTDLDSVIRAADPAAHLTAPAPLPVQVGAARGSRWLPAVGAAAAVAAVVGLALATTGSGGGSQAAGPDATSTAGPTPAPGPTGSDGLDGLPAPAKQVYRAIDAHLPLSFELVGLAWAPAPDPSSREYESSGYIRVGTLSRAVQVTYETGLPAADLCVLTAELAGAGPCRVVGTGSGADVALSTSGGTRWALYRHPDGAVVLVGDGARADLTAIGPPRSESIWTEAQLAAVATDPAFRL